MVLLDMIVQSGDFLMLLVWIERLKSLRRECWSLC